MCIVSLACITLAAAVLGAPACSRIVVPLLVGSVSIENCRSVCSGGPLQFHCLLPPCTGRPAPRCHGCTKVHNRCASSSPTAHSCSHPLHRRWLLYICPRHSHALPNSHGQPIDFAARHRYRGAFISSPHPAPTSRASPHIVRLTTQSHVTPRSAHVSPAQPQPAINALTHSAHSCTRMSFSYGTTSPICVPRYSLVQLPCRPGGT